MANFFQTIGEQIWDILALLGSKLYLFLDNLLAAVVILIVGIIIAKALAKLVEKVIGILQIDPLIRKINIIQKIENGGTRVVLSEILGWLVKWFLYIVLLMTISEILYLNQFTDFLKQIAWYLPNVIIAVLILAVGLILGDFVDGLIINVLKSTKEKLAPFAGAAAKWSIFVFSVLAALMQLGVAQTLILPLFIAVIFAISLACGLAFGLGGKEAAKDLIAKLQKDIQE